MKITLFGTLCLLSGFVSALVLSDRMAATPAAETAPTHQTARTPPVTRGLTGGLPDLTAVADRAVRASVNISSTNYVRIDPFFQFFYGADALRPQTSLGSGVVVSPDGYVLTNSHVVGNAGAEVRVTLGDNRELPATIVGLDPLTDLGVLKIEATGLDTLPWGESSQLRVAEWVLAVGNPFAFSQTVTLGIVSAVNRPDPQLSNYSDFIQTDAAINPGNSGGALVNARGELVGINTMIYSETGGYQGIGFAVPSNIARAVMDELKEHGEIVRGSIGQLGFRELDSETARRAGLSSTAGARITQMYRNEPAHVAGLLPDDVIVTYNGTAITDPSQLRRLIADSRIGSTARVEALRLRDGRRQVVDVAVIRMTPPQRRY